MKLIKVFKAILKVIKGFFFKRFFFFSKKVWNVLSNYIYFFPQKIVLIENEKIIYQTNSKKYHEVHLNNLQETLNHGIKLIEVSTETKFNQLSCLEQGIELNTELNKSKMLFLEKPVENVRKHKNIKLMSYYKRIISFLKQTKQPLNGFVTTFYKMKWKWTIF